jgi:hypothetical protein
LRQQLSHSSAQLTEHQETIGEPRIPQQPIANANANACENMEARLMVLMPTLPDKSTAQHNARIVLKPRPFDGVENKGNVALRSWFAEVQRYTFAVCWQRTALVATAAMFLVGDALQWWNKQAQLLVRLAKDPADWCTFADALFDRWSHKNQEMAARSQLHHLRQGSTPIHEHLRQFEALHTYIPTYDADPHALDREIDKIANFQLSCNAEWRDKIAVNPATNKRWTSFRDLTNYIVNFESERHADLIADAVNPLRRRVPSSLDDIPAANWAGNRRIRLPKRRTSLPRDRSRSRDRGAGGPGGNDGNRGDAGAGPSNPRPSNFAGQNRQRQFVTKNGVRFERSHHLTEWIFGRGKVRGDRKPTCVGCYGIGHSVQDCTAAPKTVPPKAYPGPQ